MSLKAMIVGLGVLALAACTTPPPPKVCPDLTNEEQTAYKRVLFDHLLGLEGLLTPDIPVNEASEEALLLPVMTCRGNSGDTGIPGTQYLFN